MPNAQVKEVELVKKDQVQSFHQNIEGIPHVSKQNKTNKQKYANNIQAPRPCMSSIQIKYPQQNHIIYKGNIEILG